MCNSDFSVPNPRCLRLPLTSTRSLTGQTSQTDVSHKWEPPAPFWTTLVGTARILMNVAALLLTDLCLVLTWYCWYSVHQIRTMDQESER